MITRILKALWAADVCLEERPCTPDTEGAIGGMVRLTPYIRAVGWHRSGNIWVAMATEAGHDMLVETIDRWLPILSKRL